MENKPKTITVDGKTFEVPDAQVLCKSCGTTNYFYDDNKPPFRCDNCGKIFDYVFPLPPIKTDF